MSVVREKLYALPPGGVLVDENVKSWRGYYLALEAIS